MFSNVSLFFVNSPLEQFEVISIIGFNFSLINSLKFFFTNFSLYSFVVLFFILSLHFVLVSTLQNNLLPSKLSIMIESLFASINTMVRSQIGFTAAGRELFLPFIYSLFFFIFLSNLIGNIPYNYTVTTSLILSISLSVSIFIGVTILGLKTHSIKFFSYFVPLGTPKGLVPMLVVIEFISYFARAFSLGIRLFANMVAGHTLLKILSGLLFTILTSSLLFFVISIIPFTIYIGLIGLELAVSVIQAYVFCILTCSYIKDALDLH